MENEVIEATTEVVAETAKKTLNNGQSMLIGGGIGVLVGVGVCKGIELVSKVWKRKKQEKVDSEAAKSAKVIHAFEEPIPTKK